MKPLDLAEFIPYRLSVLANVVSTSLARAYGQRFGLSIPEWRVMAVLAQFPGISALEVGTRTAMDRVTVSRAVARLLAKRYLHRGFSDTDKRRSELALSSAGEKIYREVVPMARAYERALIKVLTPAQRLALEDAMSSLQQRAEVLVASGFPGEGTPPEKS